MGDQATDQEEDDGAQCGEGNRSDAEARGADVPPAQVGTDQSAKQCADDAECDGDEAAGGIAAWEEEFRERACDEAEDDPMKPERHART